MKKPQINEANSDVDKIGLVKGKQREFMVIPKTKQVTYHICPICGFYSQEKLSILHHMVELHTFADADLWGLGCIYENLSGNHLKRESTFMCK